MNNKEKTLYRIHCSTSTSYAGETIKSIHIAVHSSKIKEGSCATDFDDMMYAFIEGTKVWVTEQNEQ